jgi:hypothetical protein
MACTSYLTDIGVNSCTSDAPCNQCEGNCENDEQCTGYLKCFLRDDYAEVPDCGTGG